MRVRITPSPLCGAVRILPSKSQLHRQLICAALAEKPCVIRCGETQAEDVLATIDCLTALGATISRTQSGFAVTPLKRENLPAACDLYCRESGSTLRFLLPVVAALGIKGRFHLEGRLPQRPLHPLDAILRDKGCTLTMLEERILVCEGHLAAWDYAMLGNVSSQYISGLLFALPLLEGESRLRILPPVESADYIQMTLDAMAQFGIALTEQAGVYQIPSTAAYESPQGVEAEGDWSNGAFFLVGGTLPQGQVTLTGLFPQSLQGDKAAVSVLSAMGARLAWQAETLLVQGGATRGTCMDAAPIPDLIPALAVVAAVSQGETTVVNAGRLRLKESDRITAIAQTLTALGGQVEEQAEGLRITGQSRLHGGLVHSHGDHRIVMMAAIAASVCETDVIIEGAEAVAKSYPDLFVRLGELGVRVTEEREA